MTEPTLTDKLLLLQMRQAHELLTAMCAVAKSLAFPASARDFMELANGAAVHSGILINEAQDLVHGADTEDPEEDEEQEETDDWDQTCQICRPPS